MPALILASTSPYRRELLARLGLDFEAFAPGVNENRAANEPPADAAVRLACAKAHAAAKRHPGALILAGDQLGCFEGEAIGKPGDKASARRQIGKFAGHTLTYYTAIALLAPGADSPATHLDESRVHLRALRAAEIRRYVEKENPVDCAGGLKLEGLGSALCERFETGDPAALMGLPLIAVARLLRDHGYALP